MQKKYNENPYKGQALFGGSFDPIHCGHIAIAESVLRLEFIDEVIFIPNTVSPLKCHKPLATNAQRKKMILDTITGVPGFVLDESELDRGGTSYTVDTVAKYRKISESNLYFILGADQFYQLSQWHKVDYLIDELKFLVYPREGFPIEAAPIVSNKLVHYEVLNLPYWDMSSTKIRKLCKDGQSIEHFVPSNVFDFINKHQIYQNSN